MDIIWLNKYINDVDLLADEYRLPQFLDKTVMLYPEKIAIKQKNRIIKYKEFDKQTSIIAGNLKLFGLDRQDKVCILLPNLPEAILSFWGIERAGLVTVLSNPAYNEQILLQQILDSDSKVIITTDVNANKVINLIDEAQLKYVFIVNTDNEEVSYNDKVLPWSELLVSNKGYRCDDIKPDKELAVLHYAADGGIPKATIFTHKNLTSNSYKIKERFKTILKEGNETFVGVLPYFHLYGFQLTVIYPILIGATMLPLARYMPHSLLSFFMREKATVMITGQAKFRECLAQKDIDYYDLTSVKLVISDSLLMQPCLLERFEKNTGAMIVDGYGINDASSKNALIS